jgi:uncharacterized membrane protein YagU involved in acid resistance
MQQWSVQRAIFVGGSIAGTLDILFAICFAWFNGAPPVRLLQTVASGVLGAESYSGGVAAAALGLALHFLIAYALAGAYVVASRRIPLLTRRPLVAGALFGIVVFLGMRLIVLPLSAFPHPVTFRPLATVLDGLSHMLLFGAPIALAARKASSTSASAPDASSTTRLAAS